MVVQVVSAVHRTSRENNSLEHNRTGIEGWWEVLIRYGNQRIRFISNEFRLTERRAQQVLAWFVLISAGRVVLNKFKRLIFYLNNNLECHVNSCGNGHSDVIRPTYQRVPAIILEWLWCSSTCFWNFNRKASMLNVLCWNFAKPLCVGTWRESLLPCKHNVCRPNRR